MLDKSVVKQLAIKAGMGIQVCDGDDWSDANFIWFDGDATDFAQAIANYERERLAKKFDEAGWKPYAEVIRGETK